MSSQTVSSQPSQTVVSLPLHRLRAHPANPNRISNAAFNKLVRHIERTGQYEPLVVRIHPKLKNAWQAQYLSIRNIIENINNAKVD